MRGTTLAATVAWLLAFAAPASAHDVQTDVLLEEPSANPARARSLPELPDGVTELQFREFFAPIGRRAPEYSEKLRSLEGKRVRVLGYMVQQDAPLPGRFLLVPRPLRLHETEYGLADDLPAATLFVVAQADRDRILPYAPGPMLLTGTIALGNHEEADGRTSSVRLLLDPVPAEANSKSAGPSWAAVSNTDSGDTHP